MVAAEATVAATSTTQTVQADQLIRLFNSEFQQSEQTVLVDGQRAGFAEPIYLPASHSRHGNYPYHRIIFAHGFARSALHEIAHWCVAGKVRRQLLDFGYWYAPDGRSSEQQAAFEAVEITPQAVEWLLSLAAGINFEISVDNLAGDEPPNRLQFAEQVLARAILRSEQGWPPRAWRFAQRLAVYYRQPLPDTALFKLAGAAMIRRELSRLQELS
ncbi:elongation factor P hydroxylase [Aliidiomarina haloalkalitolerans]|uniref:ABC transporter ATP-binding protein n=1 Tax=Aliidiomarina haloalkalitolerans TaxID=859059 RepID=A0A432VZ53_9GAMM|nr:elongation factor P hydroxylase [Aliidiomarina haloalkalitolerans]RUO21946.1 ABC transporter ATP-binding protein [Aliidiomarina haloalkalitolerans]